MYKIETSDIGFRLTFGGTVTKEDLEAWFQESEQALAAREGSFGVIVDMRTLTPLPVEAHDVMVRGQLMYRQHGMQRSCVILENPITTI